MSDITPRVPVGAKLIQVYGDGGIRVSGERYKGSRIITPGKVLAWPVVRFEEVDGEALLDILAEEGGVELLLFGTGMALRPLPEALRAGLAGRGIAAEVMDTGAACRTFNVLLAEGRQVAAALIAVD